MTRRENETYTFDLVNKYVSIEEATQNLKAAIAGAKLNLLNASGPAGCPVVEIAVSAGNEVALMNWYLGEEEAAAWSVKEFVECFKAN